MFTKNNPDEKSANISGYDEFVNKENSETDVVNLKTAIEEEHILNVDNNNTEHPIVVEFENFFDQNINAYIPPDENEDEEKNNCFVENEIEEFEEEKKANTEENLPEYLKFVEPELFSSLS